MSKLWTVALAAAGGLVMAGSAALAGENDPDTRMQGSGVKLMAELSGAAEVGADGKGGIGDPDGSGLFEARLNRETGQLCYQLKVDDLDDTVGAHIHSGREGINGPVAIPLKNPEDGESSDCIGVDRDAAERLIERSASYYVNVHTEDFPAGAVRGQLMK